MVAQAHLYLSEPIKFFVKLIQRDLGRCLACSLSSWSVSTRTAQLWTASANCSAATNRSVRDWLFCYLKYGSGVDVCSTSLSIDRFFNKKSKRIIGGIELDIKRVLTNTSLRWRTRNLFSNTIFFEQKKSREEMRGKVGDRETIFLYSIRVLTFLAAFLSLMLWL